MQSEISPAKGLNMKLVPSLLVFAIAAGVVPDAAAGQKARPDPVASQANQTQVTTINKDRAIGVCFGVYNPAGEQSPELLSPQGAAADYFSLYENRIANEPPLSNVELVEQPKHGKVIYSKMEDGLLHPTYVPEVNYEGDEKIVFKVSVDGTAVRVVYLLKVTRMFTDSEGAHDYLCRDTGTQWKISQPNVPVDITAMQSLLDNTGLGGAVNLGISDLPSAALGQTVGSGITLDTNAAGYNWFIDTIPADNSEFLPTSNPNEWVAKEGSAAYGKMDMLSVLLHEYGHALGIDHSADSHDYMATTLTAGVRRMPSAEELALMQQLVGQVKAGLAESTLSPTLPLQGGGGFPTLPLGANFIGFLGLLRSSRYGGVSPDK